MSERSARASIDQRPLHCGEGRADRAVPNPLDHLQIALLVTTLGSRDDGELLIIRGFRGGEDLADAHRIDRDRLLHEDMLAGCDRGFEVLRTEAGRRGEDDVVAVGGKDILIGVPTREAVLVRHARSITVSFDLSSKPVSRTRHAIGEQISERMNPHVRRRLKSVHGGTGATASATDHTDSDLVLAQ